MPILILREHTKDKSGKYFVVHRETESGIVVRPGGTSVEDDLNKFLPKVVTPIPVTLMHGAISTCDDAIYFGNSKNMPIEIAKKADIPTIPTIPTSLPAHGGDSDSVGGYSAAKLIRNDNIQSQSVNYATTAGSASTAANANSAAIVNGVVSNVVPTSFVGEGSLYFVY